MKGIISRYGEETPNPYFPERKSASSWGSTRLAFWCICRPDYRKRLNIGDVVLFVRKLDETSRGRATFCSGVLTVGSIVDETIGTRLFGLRWRREYEKQVREHEKEHGTKHWRNYIATGAIGASFWRGKNGIDLTKGKHRIRFKQGRTITPYRDKAKLRRIVAILRGRKFAPFDDEGPSVDRRRVCLNEIRT